MDKEGIVELMDEDLDQVTGGNALKDIVEKLYEDPKDKAISDRIYGRQVPKSTPIE